MHQHYPKRQQIAAAINTLRQYGVHVTRQGKHYRYWHHGYTSTYRAHEILWFASIFREKWNKPSTFSRKLHHRKIRRQAARHILTVDSTQPTAINPHVEATCNCCLIMTTSAFYDTTHLFH